MKMDTKPIIDIVGIGILAGVSFKTLDIIDKNSKLTLKEVSQMAYRRKRKGTRKKRRKSRRRRR